MHLDPPHLRRHICIPKSMAGVGAWGFAWNSDPHNKAGGWISGVERSGEERRPRENTARRTRRLDVIRERRTHGSAERQNQMISEGGRLKHEPNANTASPRLPGPNDTGTSGFFSWGQRCSKTFKMLAIAIQLCWEIRNLPRRPWRWQRSPEPSQALCCCRLYL